jgi:hypothetical protein
MNRLPFVSVTVLTIAMLFAVSCSTNSENGSSKSTEPQPNAKRTAQDMLRDDSIFNVEYLAQTMSHGSSVSDVFMTTDEQGLKKNVKLADIITRYGEPDKKRKTEKEETSAVYFDKIQFMADRDGIIHFAYIKTK